jgi:VanZ family protein
LLLSENVAGTRFGGGAEHVLAYAVTASIAALAFSERLVAVLLALFVYAGALEFIQHFVSGRTPSFEDLLCSGCGVLIAGLAVVLFSRVLGLQGNL